MAESGGAVVAVVLGAGQGTRMGAGRNKVLLTLSGKPVLVRAIAAFERTPQVTETLLVAHPDEVTMCQEMVAEYGLAKVAAVIPGGASRHQSEDRALNWLRPRIETGEIALVLVHDGARPLITPDEIAALITATAATGGALLATAPDEPLVQLDGEGYVTRAWPSDELALAQTPQAFDARRLLAAYDAARADGFEGSDTAASFERAGGQVRVVFATSDNLKITTPDDLVRAEALLASRMKTN
ncbi:MAG TPA: 2-C-methyl-D-erythritol 4-phosphate cytidylyltransferase [Ktedonobacterales bacterium]|jgi:2-C-methyl-D-erythritol 4-phosphate cytidylyltransferase